MDLIHPDVAILSDDTVWNGRFTLHVIKFRNRRFDGAMSGVRTWELLCRGRAAAVVPYDPVTDKVVVIDQFRLPALAAGMDPVMTELCAGLCDGDDTAEQTILREAHEEMGLEVSDLHRIGAFLLTPGGSEEHCTLFAGRVHVGATGPGGLMGYHGLASENEDIRVRALPAQTAIDNALAGVYPNSVTTIGLLWLAARRAWLREKWLAS
jgi:ADP-ribose pyrophosphatase